MTHYRFVLLGFGNVGQAFIRLLLRKEAELRQRYDITFSMTGISTGRHGRAINPAGIDLQAALDCRQAGGSLDSLSLAPAPSDVPEFLRQCPAEVLVENIPVNYESGQPALSYIETALKLGLHAISANKGPVVHGFRHLTELAKAHGKHYFFESAVMDGAPIFSMFRSTLPGAELKSIRGVLNSTTNLILSLMEKGETFDRAVAYAQKVGLAETDPSGDIDGWDAAVKVAALSTVLMDAPMKPAEVERQGIRDITPAQIEQARGLGKRWKLVCSTRREAGRVVGRVWPEMVPADSPLYLVEGSTSIVQFETDVLGLLTLTENDPGPHTTAYGLLADFINAVQT